MIRIQAVSLKDCRFSRLFIDRQPMGPHDLIQAFSRTNRIFDRNKTYGQIVTFQAPKLFRKSVDDAVKLYSAGSTGKTSSKIQV